MRLQIQTETPWRQRSKRKQTGACTYWNQERASSTTAPNSRRASLARRSSRIIRRELGAVVLAS